MISNLPKILTIIFCLSGIFTQAQEIWRESFTIPEKGIWGDGNGTLISDFSEIETWSLEYPGITLSCQDDYAKTVSTSGGRFECRDIDGEVKWISEKIDISGYQNVRIQLNASETGSSDNVSQKYLKAFYCLDNKNEILFPLNGENQGNWGSNVAEVENLNGDFVQLAVYLCNHYSSDKVILDEVVVWGEEEVAEPAAQGEIVINEVLFNPVPGGNDFVEIYNNSEKEISTKHLSLASRNKNLELEQIYQLTATNIFLPPKSYLALTKDTNGVFPWFEIHCPACFLQMNKFPSFNNDEDYVVLLNNEMEVVDEFYYTEKMHTPVLADREGVSLERISFTKTTNLTENWHSASSLSGYGTPGYENSQIENSVQNKPQVNFSPESFSPNLDGYNDEFQINYTLEKPGYTANVWIFDSAGRLIFQLAKNEILGTSGKITWNGEDETGQRQNLGVYVVLMEIFDLQGNVYRFKEGVVLTDVLD